MAALATANDDGRSWPGATASAIAFSLAGLFTRLIDLDVRTVLFWRALFGGIFIAGYIVRREGRRVLAAIRRTGIAGAAVTISSALATICFINAPTSCSRNPAQRSCHSVPWRRPVRHGR
jgi:drug/metabolite transporter (DMT)-like permease